MLGIFLDIEASGLDMQQHRPLSIAIILLDLGSGKTLETFTSMIEISDSDWKKGNPESLRINGITKAMLEGAPSITEVKKAVMALFDRYQITRKNSVFICQNPSFDRAFFHKIISATEQEKMQWPYHWLDLASMFWSKQMDKAPPLPWELGISKNQIADFYNLEKEDLPHTAIGGVKHLITCYEAVVGFPETSS
jgi:oligoribonuclease